MKLGFLAHPLYFHDVGTRRVASCLFISVARLEGEKTCEKVARLAEKHYLCGQNRLLS